jgi:hypothetical protein
MFKAPLGKPAIYKGKNLTRASKRKTREATKTHKTPTTLKPETHTKRSTQKKREPCFSHTLRTRLHSNGAFLVQKFPSTSGTSTLNRPRMVLFNGCQESHNLILIPFTQKPHHWTNILKTKKSPIQGSEERKNT